MENTNDIMTSLRVASQIPLDRKAWCIDEDTLKDFGVDDQLAYTYHKGLKVICIQNRTIYEWKEIETGDIGLRITNFIYPSSWIRDGIDYSNKIYNFVLYLGEIITPFISIDEGDGKGIIIRDRNPDNFGTIGFGAIDFSKSFGSSSYGAKAWFSSILNGQDQEITSTSEGSIIGAGFRNYINAKLSGIFTGSNNIIDGIGGGRFYFIGGGTGNIIQENSFIGSSAILSGNLGTINTYYATILNGDTNIITLLGIFGLIGGGDNNEVSAYQGVVLQGSNNKATGNLSTVINGTNCEAKGVLSIVLNGDNIADSYSEIVGGCFGTTYEPESRTTFNSNDRIFNIGVGIDDSNRKDGLSLFKNGVLLLKELSIAKITSANNKVVITKEYLLDYLNTFIDTTLIDGDNTTVLGSGTTADPHKIIANIPIVGGTGISITGNGILTPYNISISKGAIINLGFFDGLAIGSSTTLTPGGDISAASVIYGAGPETIVLVTLVIPMLNDTYIVNTTIQGKSSDIKDDGDLVAPIYKIINTTQFQLLFREKSTTIRDLRINITTCNGTI